MAKICSKFSRPCWQRALAFQLGGIEVENNLDLSLPRSSKVSIYSSLPDNNSPIEFGWDAKLGPLVVRQQDITANPDNLYTAYLAPGKHQRTNSATRVRGPINTSNYHRLH